MSIWYGISEKTKTRIFLNTVWKTAVQEGRFKSVNAKNL